jgi:hypothetical protein
LQCRNVLGKPAAEPWGLIAMWIEDPTASASPWSRFPPVTLSAMTRATKMTTDTRQMCARFGSDGCFSVSVG